MSRTINAARTLAHLSRHERQRLARAEAFSRRTAASPPATAAIQLQQGELELIEGLVRHNRTAVSSAVLAIAGIGAGSARRRAVLALIDEVARSAQAQGAISPERGAQIARRVGRELRGDEAALAG